MLVSSRPARYALAVVATGAAFALRVGLARFFGPPYILFYPAVMLTAVLGGVGPGLVATALSAVLAAAWILPPERQFLPMSSREAVSLFAFTAMGALMSAVAGLYRRARRQVAQYEKEVALGEADERVRASEERLRLTRDAASVGAAQLEAVFQAMSDGVVVFDMSGNAVLVNEAEARINGFPSAADMKRNLAFFAEVYELSDLEGRALPVEDWPVSRVLRGESVSDLELKGRRRDTGQEWFFGFSGEPVRGERGEQVLAVVITRDITRRKEAQEALRHSEALLSAIATSIPDPVFLKDRDGRWLFANPAALQAIGRPGEETLGRTDREIFSDPRVAEALMETDRRIMESGVPEAVEENVQTATGYRTYLSTKAPYRDAEGRVVGLVGAARDVTDLRRAEEQFRQAQKLESVGRLAGGVAHDFNNLLIGILGYAEFLEEGIREGRPRTEDLAEIRKAGERARDLTSQLLSVARRQVIEPRPVDPNEVLLDSEKLLRRLLGEDVDMRFRLEPGVGTVVADPSQLQQVVMNLAVNARDAMPRGGRLTIETSSVQLDARYARHHAEVEPGPYVMIAVSDSGEGMSPEAQAHLFEPFFTTKAAGRGTGLGLATVHGIVKQAGGHIWVYSEAGRGTTFKIYLPLRAEVPARAREPAPPPAPGGHECVLLVEDDPSARALARRALGGAGYEVLAAANGREALEVVAASPRPPDLVLTDVVMPEMSGKELADALLRARPSLRVLYLSGYTEDTIVHHGILDSTINLLPKPYTPSALLARVREVLDAG
jgi:PAS domain S-box-containing protein